MDLTSALYVLGLENGRGNPKGLKMGIIKKTIESLSSYNAGEVVLYEICMSPDSSQLQMGEYRGMTPKPTGKVVVHRPLSREEIEKRRAKGDLITCIGTIINVPDSYVEEIKLD